jgi:hypothetical protein
VSAVGWVGFDLDGTLAVQEPWMGPDQIGAPVPAMVERCQQYLRDGVPVKIMTARMSEPSPVVRDRVLRAIHEWTQLYVGQALPATNIKDYGMIRLYDDRAVQVEHNTGRIIE